MAGVSTSKEIDIVTGYQGKPHVMAAQDARCIAGIVGRDAYILDIGQKFSIKINSPTQITIGSGDAIICGRHVTIEAPIQLPLKPGSQGMKRGSIVCLRVEAAQKGSEDKAKIIVMDGEETSGNFEYPYIKNDDILSGSGMWDMSLWLIPIDGITVGDPRPAIHYHTLPSISELKGEIKSDVASDLATAKADIARIKADIAAINAKFSY